MLAKLCRFLSDDHSKKRNSRKAEDKVRDVEQICCENQSELKENECQEQVQSVDLVANCPLSLTPSTPSPDQFVMGQHSSSVSRPKISLTWVLRSQSQSQHQQHINSHLESDNLGTISRKSKQLSSKTNVKGITSKSELEHSNKDDKNDKISRVEKAFVKEKQEEIKEDVTMQKENDKLKKATSEPSLVFRNSSSNTTSRKEHRHRRSKCNNKSGAPTRFGYEIADLDSFLTKASIGRPANIPVVLSFPSVLYKTKDGQDQVALPLGTVVNAIFKNEAWLYVQTPHGQEGYVGYASCIPLGIIPQRTCGPCWEDPNDILPRLLGNMTDNEKLRDTTSECGSQDRNPRVKKAGKDKMNLSTTW